MVLKLRATYDHPFFEFYSSVILNGTETKAVTSKLLLRFYSSVILNGTETVDAEYCVVDAFYSSVILNGTETSVAGRND